MWAELHKRQTNLMRTEFLRYHLTQPKPHEALEYEGQERFIGFAALCPGI